MNHRQCYTRSSLANRWRVSPDYVKQLIAEGKLSVLHLPYRSRPLITPEEVARFEQENKGRQREAVRTATWDGVFD